MVEISLLIITITNVILYIYIISQKNAPISAPFVPSSCKVLAVICPSENL